jgi:uncharacterized protein YjbI with pentapeptide repeats
MSFVEESYFQEKFAKLSVTGETIHEKTFEQCEFNACSFIECRFEKCRFLNCTFNSCVVSAVDLTNSRFIDPKFAKSKVLGIDWTKTKEISEPAFNECQINYSSFKMLKIPRTKIIKCEAKEADFTETDLTDGDFKNTDFEHSRFFKTNLTRADFKGACNYLIDVRTNTIKKACFSLPEAMGLLNGLDIFVE